MLSVKIIIMFLSRNRGEIYFTVVRLNTRKDVRNHRTNYIITKRLLFIY